MSASRLSISLLAISALVFLPGCGLLGVIGFLGGTSQFRARTEVCEDYYDWRVACSEDPVDTADTGLPDHPTCFLGGCSDWQIGNMRDWLACAEEEGCGLGACDKKLERVDLECRPDDLVGY